MKLNEKYMKLSAIQAITQVNIDESKIKLVKDLIPTKKNNPAHKAKRRELFNLFVKDNKKCLTEDEMRSGILNVLKLGDIIEAKDAITTAFQSACGAVK